MTTLLDPVTPCSVKLDAEPWAGTIPLDLDGFVLGVRAGTPELEDALRALLAPHVTGDAEVQANYSIRLPDRRAVGAGLAILYRAWTPFVRARGPRRVVDGLLAHLTDQRDAERSGLVVVRAATLVRDGRAAIVPIDFFTHLGDFQRRVEAAGWRIADRPRATLDPATGHAVVRAADLAVDERAYAELVGDDEPAVPAAPPGTYPVERWVLPGGPLRSRGHAVQVAAALVDGGRATRPGATVLGTLEASVRAATNLADVDDLGAWREVLS